MNDGCALGGARVSDNAHPLRRQSLPGQSRERLADRVDIGRTDIPRANDWFFVDSTPRFLVNADGHLLSANRSGQAILHDGQVVAKSAGSLKFGSAACDLRFLASVRAVAGRGLRSCAVLRRRHGGWYAAEIQGGDVPALVMVGLREELAPRTQSMDAIADAFNLTASEQSVLRFVLDGHCPKSAAIALTVSEHTVRAHLRSIYAKMNVRGLSSTIRLACSFL